MSQNEYMEGNASVRLALIALLLVGIGLFFTLQQLVGEIIVEIAWIVDSQPRVAIRMGNRLLLWLVVLSGAVSFVIGAYLYLLTVRVMREGRFPPSQLPLAFRTRILRGIKACQFGRRYRWLALLLCCQPFVGLAFWFWVSGGVL